MKNTLKHYVIILTMLMSLNALAQKPSITSYNTSGKVYFKDGSVKTGKITFETRELYLKEEGGKRVKVDKETVDKFESYNKKGKKNWNLYLCLE